MKVCITRNNNAENQSGIYRALDAIYSAGHEAILLTRDRSKKTQDIVKGNIEFNGNIIENYIISIPAVIGGGLKNMKSLINYMNQVYKWLVDNKDKYDVIHAFDLDTGLPAMKACKKINKEYIYHISDFYADSRKGIPNILYNSIKKLEFKVINRSYGTVICTEARKEQISGSKPNNLLVVHNSPSLIREDDLSYEPKLNNPIKLCYVGGLAKRRFIKDAVDVIKGDSRFTLELAGRGDQEEYIKEISKEYDNISFHGLVDYDKALEMYSNCDILFAIYNPEVKNHKYSAPNKFYEAMYFGKLIIVAKGTGVDKLVEKEENGLVVNYDKDSFKEALDFIYNNELKVKEMMVNSYNAYDKYSWSNMRKKLGYLYKDLASK